MKIRLITTLAIVAIASGCSDKKEEAATADSSSAMPNAPAVEMLDPNAVLVEVNGEKLTVAEADKEVNYRLARIGAQLPPEQIETVRWQFRNNAMDSFTARSLLTGETKAKNITVSKEEEAEMYEKLKESLPPGMTIEEAMKQSPMGEEKMKEEIISGIKINKLLESIIDKDMKISKDEIKAFKAENAERLSIPASVQARHILFTVDAEADDKAKEEKKKKAEDILKQLKDGGDFAELAKANSDCPSSAKGGDLGQFGRGQMVKPFEDAAFSQKINAIGDIIETQFGYHIIQVTDKKEAGEVPEEKIIEAIKGKKQQETVEAYVQSLKDKADIKRMDLPKPASSQMMPMMMPPQPPQ